MTFAKTATESQKRHNSDGWRSLLSKNISFERRPNAVANWCLAEQVADCTTLWARRLRNETSLSNWCLHSWHVGTSSQSMTISGHFSARRTGPLGTIRHMSVISDRNNSQFCLTDRQARFAASSVLTQDGAAVWFWPRASAASERYGV